MSDIAPVVETAPVADAPVVDAPVVDVPAADVFDDAKVQSFDRPYVEKIRKEAADRRTAMKPYEEAFGGYNAEEQAVWFDLAKQLANDPKAAAARFQEIATGILGADEPAAVEPPEGADKPLTQAELDAKLKERDDANQLREITAKIESDAAGLGYKKEDAEGWRDLMVTAQYVTNGDLHAAHAHLVAKKQGWIDGYLKEKETGGVKLPTNGGTPGQPAEPVTTFASASDAFRASMANM